VAVELRIGTGHSGEDIVLKLAHKLTHFLDEQMEVAANNEQEMVVHKSFDAADNFVGKWKAAEPQNCHLSTGHYCLAEVVEA
jgi:hypothetical protein